MTHLGFILSLPRSGSTYVQRVLSGSDEVATTPEPWLLPALMGIRHGAAPYAEFAYDHVRAALDDVLASLEEPDEAWRAAQRAMAESFYSNFAEPGQIYIDKTPRNAPFAGEILATFPEAPVLFLWRNPLAIINSINEAWGKGRWKAYFYEYDLRVGLPALIDTWLEVKDRPNVLALRYEDIVSEPDIYWPMIFAHFGVGYRSEQIVRPPLMRSRMGDVTGQAKYSSTDTRSVSAWQSGFGSAIRKRWSRSYLRDIGEDRLSEIGYPLEELLESLGAAKGRTYPSDYLLVPAHRLYHKLDLHVFRQKWKSRGSRRFAHR